MIIRDTNVVSELMRPGPDPNVVDWVTRQAAFNLYLSTVSEAELRYGVEILPTGARRDRLSDEVEGMLGRTLPGASFPSTVPQPLTPAAPYARVSRVASPFYMSVNTICRIQSLPNDR